MMGQTHELKVWPEYYEALANGTKTFEYRKNDRGFEVNQLLWLSEWNPKIEEYTKRSMLFEIQYILYGGKMGIPEGYCIMSLGIPIIVNEGE